MQNLPTKERFSVPVADTPGVTNVSPSLPYNRNEWQRGYQSQPNEYDYWIDDVEGQIPAGLQGTLFRNGPGLLDINGQRLHHPFDGDGMISAITIKDGRAHFRNRFVRTEGFVKEQAAGKILYRGVFGTQKPGGWLANAFDLQIKNIANTNVIYWGGKLLALWEAAEPYRLDPNTLDTLGKDYLDGVLQEGDAFGAHPWIDPSCQLDGGAPCLVNFSIKTGLSSTITLYEFSPTGQLLRRHAHSVPGFAFIHDFAITPNYCLFFQNPVNFNPIPFLLGLRGAGECVKFQPNQPTNIIVIPRTPPYSQGVQIVQVQSGFVFHHANAFEQDGKIYIDSISYDELPEVSPNSDFRQVDFESLTPGQLWRFTLNLSEKTVSRQRLAERCCEFPSIHPDYVGRSYRYLFMGTAHNPTGNAPLQAILKLDVRTGTEQVWSAAPQGYVSEPIFVPKPEATGEDDGWVLTLVYNARYHRSEVVILDGRDLNRKPIARLHLKHHIPYGLHGNWTSQCFEI
ncbi:MAG TPA: carotenoid oxygenase family protein [Coleofasciculaceae cyanobacterium]